MDPTGEGHHVRQSVQAADAEGRRLSPRRWAPRDLVRFWWLERRATSLGCGLTLAMAVVIMIGVALVLWPVAKSEVVEGRIEGFGLSETDFGSQAVAYVAFEGGRDRVPIRPQDACQVGDRVRLHTLRHVWGRSAGVMRDGKPVCLRG